ncbi:hypothetical protein BY996DRAFT_4610948, partial [Phakopsora pachyrhizi]
MSTSSTPQSLLNRPESTSTNPSQSSSSPATSSSASSSRIGLSTLFQFNPSKSKPTNYLNDQYYHCKLNLEVLDPQHLYLLLLRFQEVGLDPGRIDQRITRRGVKPYSPTDRLFSHNPTSTNSSHSLNIFSALSISPAWWPRTSKKSTPSFSSELDLINFIYSSLTRLPDLTLTKSCDLSHLISSGLPIQLFKGNHIPAQSLIPLYCFKSLTKLVIQDLDPRIFSGWNQLSQNLRVLELHRSGIEDLESLLIDAVMDDVERERRENSKESDLRSEPTTPSGSALTSIGDQKASSLTQEPKLMDSPTTSDLLLPIDFPSFSWNFLRHLSLSDNSLTFIPSNPLKTLVSLNSLDLSSNFLIAIPNGLGNLTRLRYIDLSNNLIESVLGIYQSLGNITSLDLSRNRLHLLCGVERLYSLEKLNIQKNQIHDITELSRLATLPQLKYLWTSENPFCQVFKNYRIQVFNYFGSEGRDIDQLNSGIELTLDNLKNSYQEKRLIIKRTKLPPGQSSSPTLNRSVSIGDYLHTQKKKTVRQIKIKSTRTGQGINVHQNGQGQQEQLEDLATYNDNHHRRKRIINLENKKNNDDLAMNESKDHSTSGLISSSSSSNIGQMRNTRRVGSRDLKTQSIASNLALSSKVMSKDDKGGGGAEFRRKIEALRDEVGESWLKVLGESVEFGPSESDS